MKKAEFSTIEKSLNRCEKIEKGFCPECGSKIHWSEDPEDLVPISELTGLGFKEIGPGIYYQEKTGNPSLKLSKNDLRLKKLAKEKRIKRRMKSLNLSKNKGSDKLK